MGDPMLTAAATLLCPHGGLGSVTPSSTAVTAGSAVCTVADQVTIVGCPFMVGPSPSPCVSVQWQTAATAVTVGGTAVLTTGSQGLCLNPAAVPQGSVILTPAQAAAVAT